MPFKTMGLADPLVKGILATGYTAPTDIQSQAIPAILDGKDIIGCAQTGTGKTAAFVLPMLHRLETVPPKSKKKKPRVLVVTPTRELAVQIEQAVRGYGRYMELRTLAVYGGTRIETQMKALRRGIDVVVATPGRLLDLINRGVMNLSLVEVLVLDEADRMFDMGFITDIRKIVKEIPDKRQTLLFSATMPNAIKKLTESIQKSPVMIQIGRQHNPIETITQHIFPVPKAQKMDLLLHLIEREEMDSVLVFSRTRRGADRICKKLKQNYVEAVAIHSDRTQGQRLKALEGFKRGKYQVLVATDIAARGINVEGISHVVNFDVPGYAEDYIHRIGRTGRATATGDAITFVSEEEGLNLRKIERFIETKFKPRMVEGFAYTHRVSLESGPGSKKGGKPSKPGSAQRKRAKAQQAKKPRKLGAKPHGKPGSSEKSGKQSSAKKRSGFKHAKKKASDKRDSSFGNKRSASSKPKSMKKSWSRKKRPAQGRKPKNS
ncbi:MAG: DEAD/DEAH box helicase [Anaerohalosphaeraceae bacterium]